MSIWEKKITFVNNMEENSSFIGKSSISVFEDAVPVVSANGATSSSYIVRMHGKRMFLKHIRKEYADDERYENAFRKEFEVGFNLDHPGIVRYYEYGKDDCGSYILSEYIEGCTLTEFVVKNPEYLRVKANLDKMTNQILDALGYMHEHQILHLDIKPDNILVTSIDHDVKFIDFGFCYSDSFYGTQGHSPEYASSEQLQNLSNYDERTDIYSFGRLLSFIFASVGMKPDSRYKKLLNGCLQDDMKKRFSSAEEAAKCISRGTFGVAHYVAAVIALFVVCQMAVAYWLRNDGNTMQAVTLPTELHEEVTPCVTFANEQIVDDFLDSAFRAPYKSLEYLWKDGNMSTCMDSLATDEKERVFMNVYDLSVHISTIIEDEMLEATKRFPTYRVYIYKTYRSHIDCPNRDSLYKMMEMYNIR